MPTTTINHFQKANEFLPMQDSLEGILKPETVFPFPTRLSFLPLIKYLKDKIESAQLNSDFWRGLINQIESTSVLNQPIEDVEVLKDYQPMVEALISSVFPIATGESELRAAIPPFQLSFFQATPAFNRLIKFKDGKPNIVNYDPEEKAYQKQIIAYKIILQRIYGVKSELSEPMIFTVPDPENGLNRHYLGNILSDFVELIPLKTPPTFTEKELRELTKKAFEPKLLSKYINPQDYVFQGVNFFQMIDITDTHILSLLKDELMKREALLSNNHFDVLQDRLREFFRLPDIRLGIVAFDPNQNTLQEGPAIWHSFISETSSALSCSSHEGCLYDKTMLQNRPIVVEDLETYPDKTEVEKLIINQGIRNLLIAPLYYNNELVGMLELGSPNIGDLDTYSISKLQQVIPLFSMAVKRKIEDISTEVEVIKQKEFTAIHPTVAWRFNQAAYNLKLKKDTGQDEVMEPIVFEDVYPLFGQLDIRGSSRERNKSIQQDLQHQLQLAGNIISAIHHYQPLPIFDELSYRVQKNLDDIKDGVNAGDEVNILDFIRNEIELLVAEFEGKDARIDEACLIYKNALDANLGIIYNRRKDFEQSLTRINEKVSLFLDQKEAEAQHMFPHYFEKYKTDGVEFNIYIGDSLSRERAFSPIYLENLRLWQLETIAEATILTETLRHRLPVPLQTTQLILVQSSPLSIRFRQDEKQFDVDGAYNIRYEIVKKRIDKALIKGTDERLTQPGKIAIVYSQDKEIGEYIRHISYLQSKSLLEPEVEFLELEELQGASGLKAIRVTVTYPSKTEQ